MLTTKLGSPQRSRLASMIVAAPYVERPIQACDHVEAWLKGLGSPAGTILTELVGDYPLVMDLMAGLCGGSVFLWRLATDDPDRLLRLLNCDPEPYLADLLSTNAVAIGNSTTVTGTSAIAIGQAAMATGAFGAALGANAQATGPNSIAIGGNAAGNAGNAAIASGANA